MYYYHKKRFRFFSPTFKTAMPTSRTQLKLQLQREQQQQEQQQILMQQQQQQQLLHTQDQTMLNAFGMQTAGFQYNTIESSNRTSDCGSGSSCSLNQHQHSQQQQQQSITQLGQKDRLPASSPVALKVPLQSIGVDVPPQVLQVKANVIRFFTCTDDSIIFVHDIISRGRFFTPLQTQSIYIFYL